MLDLLPQVWFEQGHVGEQKQEGGLISQLAARLNMRKK